MSILGIHHYGIVVRSIESHYEKNMRHLIPAGLGETFHDPLQEVNVTFLQMPGGTLELVEPTTTESAISRLLKKQGAVYHHICVMTDDIEIELESCRSAGQFVISEPKPAVAFQGSNIAFVMGRDGLLWELLEDTSGVLINA